MPLPCRLVDGARFVGGRSCARPTDRVGATGSSGIPRRRSGGSRPGRACLRQCSTLGGEGTLAPDTVLWVSILARTGPLALRLRYRTDVLDADAAARSPAITSPRWRRSPLIRRPSMGGKPCSARPSSASSSTGWPDLGGAADPADARAVRAAAGRTPTHRGDLRRQAVDLRRAQRPRSRLGRARWPGPSPRGRRGRGDSSATWTGWPPSWRSSRPVGSPAHRAALPGRPHRQDAVPRAGCELVLTEPGSTTTLGQSWRACPAADALRRGRLPGKPRRR